MFTSLFISGLAEAALLFLVASGLSLIFGVTKIVNFAHGSFFMIGAYIAASLLPLGALSGVGGLAWFLGCMAVGALVSGAIGIGFERLVLKRFYHAHELVQLVVTFALALIVEDAVHLLFGNEDLYPLLPSLLLQRLSLGPLAMPAYEVFVIAFALIIFMLLYQLIYKGAFGLKVRAAAQDSQMLACLKVDPRLIYALTFALGTGLAGLAGGLSVLKSGASIGMDSAILGPAFVVVVMGGMGSLTGTALASLVIGLTISFGTFYLPQASLLLIFIVMFISLWFFPNGLLSLFERSRAPAHQPAHDAGSFFDVNIPPFAPFHKSPAHKYFIAFALLLMAGLALAPLWALPIAQDIMLSGLLALGLALLVGVAGLVSFAQAAIAGGAAYGAALLVSGVGGSMGFAILLAAGLGALLQWIMVGLCQRLSGVYFAMMSLALAQSLWALTTQWIGVTGGDNGIIGLWPSAYGLSQSLWPDLDAVEAQKRDFALLLGLIFILAIALYWRVRASHGALQLLALRDDVRGGTALGLHSHGLQRQFALLVGALTGLVGGFAVFAAGGVFPYMLEAVHSFEIIVMGFLGGMSSLFRPLFGGAAYVLLENIAGRVDIWRLLLGLSLIGLSLLVMHRRTSLKAGA